MKSAYLVFALFTLAACGKSSNSNNVDIPRQGTAAPLLNLDTQTLPLALAPEAFVKAKPDSVVECQPTDAGDTKCRLASEILSNVVDEQIQAAIFNPSLNFTVMSITSANSL